MAAAALVGLWAFPDAISRLRALGSPYVEVDRACDPGRAPCVATFPDGTAVRFAATPQPAGQGQPVAVRVEVEGDATPVALEVQGVEMAMGFVRLPFERSGSAWALTLDLPVCTTDRMLWKADVVMDDRVAGFFLWSIR